MPPKTTIEKSQSPSPDVTVFKISGTLGFHEKETLEKLFRECHKRDIQRVVLDVAGLTSLGGGCASILRNEAGNGMSVCLAGAKNTVLKFLQREKSSVHTAETVEAGIELVLEQPPGGAPAPVTESDDELVSDEALESVLASKKAQEQPESSGDAAKSDDSADAAQAPPMAPDPPVTPSRRATDNPPPEQPAPAAKQAPAAATASTPPSPASGVQGGSRELQKRIVQYNTLFAINSDFGRIQDRKSLLELFLLTTIAQVGVESAMFLENMQNYFVPTAMKGIQADEVRGFALPAAALNLEVWGGTPEVHTIEDAPFSDEAKAPFLSLGCCYVAPFIVHGDFRGVLMLGKPIKNDLDDSTIEFLKILINQAAVAYESLSRFQEENERTLGLVQTLISLIEENTLARGNTHMVSSYVYALGQSLHYPEEHLRNLMYGTVLRDIGMIKVSDLIVRSPRELMPEEWEIIKRHPIDGAEMLERMRFSDHAVKIVLCHHERFNGEGYPNGVHGQDIPLGARVVSVVESYAAMLQERPTRPALTQEEALNTLRENWGMRYDPDVVKHFVELVEEEIRSGSRVADQKFELFSV